MTIRRRTVVLGLPTLAGMLLSGCGGGEDATTQSQSLGGLERASAQSVTTGSLKISILNGIASTGGTFPSTGTSLAPNEGLIQACVNAQELNVILKDVTGSFARALSLKLIRTSGWAVTGNTTIIQSINMTPGATDYNGSEGYIFHHPDQLTPPTTSNKWYGYKITSGRLTATVTSSTVKLVFSPNITNDLVRATPAGPGFASRPNDATGYVFIPYNDTVTVRVANETEASA